MSNDLFSGIGSFNTISPIDPFAYQQRLMMRQNLLSERDLFPIAQPSVEEIVMMQGFYNSCLGNIEQLRYGCNFPSLLPMVSQNPQILIYYIMHRQMQMQNMMLMMLLMQQNAAFTRMILQLLLSRNYQYSQPGAISGSCSTISDPNKAQKDAMLENAARKYGIPPDILKAIAWQESRWKTGAVGDGGKSFGMMQIYSCAHPDYNVREGINNPEYNIDYAARLLRSLYDKYGSWEKAVERYNGSGPMAVRYAASVMNHAQTRPWLA